MMVPPKRFYTKVAVVPVADHGTPLMIELDGKPVRTPARRILKIAHNRLAEAISAEWQAQGAKVEVAAMPLTRLTMSVNDHVEPRVAGVQSEVLAYGATDLLCYRAAEPLRLFERQSALWQPYLDWASAELGAPLAATAGVKPVEQLPAALAALRNAVCAFDAYRLLALHSLTAKLGSVVLALAVLHGRATALQALEVSRLDEIFQAEIWGLDWAAEQRLAAITREVEDLARFVSLLD